MRNRSFIYKPRVQLDKEHHDTVLSEIEMVNLTRMKIMLPVLFIIEILFIIFNDLPYYRNPAADVIWNESGYFTVHLLLLFVSVIGFFITEKLIKLGSGKWKPIYRYFIPGILTVYLILFSLIDVIDQMHIKNISSLFVANLLICGGIFSLNFPKNLYTYTIPFFINIISYFGFGFDRDVMISHGINSLIFYIAVIILSTSIFHYQYEVIAENILLEKANQRLDYYSNHDPLTGLLNRRYFMEQMENNPEGKTKQAALVLADIDYFKNVNDQYGHPVGDLVLIKVSSVLLNHVKDGNLAVRWGGEEFLLYLYDTSMEQAYAFTEHLQQEIGKLMIQINGHVIQVTASFGITVVNNETDNSFYSAYKAADAALYEAKNQGRNRTVKAKLQ